MEGPKDVVGVTVVGVFVVVVAVVVGDVEVITSLIGSYMVSKFVIGERKRFGRGRRTKKVRGKARERERERQGGERAGVSRRETRG